MERIMLAVVFVTEEEYQKGSGDCRWYEGGERMYTHSGRLVSYTVNSWRGRGTQRIIRTDRWCEISPSQPGADGEVYIC